MPAWHFTFPSTVKMRDVMKTAARLVSTLSQHEPCKQINNQAYLSQFPVIYLLPYSLFKTLLKIPRAVSLLNKTEFPAFNLQFKVYIYVSCWKENMIQSPDMRAASGVKREWIRNNLQDKSSQARKEMRKMTLNSFMKGTIIKMLSFSTVKEGKE